MHGSLRKAFRFRLCTRVENLPCATMDGAGRSVATNAKREQGCSRRSLPLGTGEDKAAAATVAGHSKLGSCRHHGDLMTLVSS